MTRSRPHDREAPGEGAAPPKGALGSWLRQQREARGVSLRDIADASKISLRYLEALEQERFDVLPAPVFAKGFLREYARVVGLDADEAVNLYLLAQGGAEAARADEPAVAPPLARRSAAPSTWGYGLLLTLAVVLFLGVAALLSFYAGRRRAAAPVPVAAATATLAPPRAPAPAAEPPVELPADVAPTATAVPAAEPASGPLRLHLEFAEDCWVELVVDGRRRSSELRAGGETLQVEAERFVLLTLGNARAVRAEVDGRPFPLPTEAGRVVRDLRIERAAPAGAAPS
jgi:cytoskeletal protein RodZ